LKKFFNFKNYFLVKEILILVRDNYFLKNFYFSQKIFANSNNLSIIKIKKEIFINLKGGVLYGT